MKKLPSSGFTLIELLIVITIIAVLSAIGLIAYSNFLKTSRDSRRQSDLKFIQSGLEDFHSDQLYYPSSLVSDTALQFTSGSITKIYLNKVPKDPLSSQQYIYKAKPDSCSGAACIRYCLYAALEKPPSFCATNPSACASDPSNCYCTDDATNCPVPQTIDSQTYNYAVTRP